MDEGMWNWEEKRTHMTEGLRSWKWPQRKNRHPKNGNKIKLRNEGTSNEKLAEWEGKKDICCEGMNTSFQTLIKTSCKILKFSPGSACCFCLQLDPDGWTALAEKSQGLWSQWDTAAREAHKKNHWISETQPKIISTLKGPPIKMKSLNLTLGCVIFICLNFFKINMVSSLILIIIRLKQINESCCDY